MNELLREEEDKLKELETSYANKRDAESLADLWFCKGRIDGLKSAIEFLKQ